MSNWYYTKDGQSVGPVTFDALKSIHQAGGLSHPDALVWQEGTPDWVSPSTVEGLGATASSNAIQNPYAAPTKSANLAPAQTVPGELPVIEPGSSPLSIGAITTKAWQTFKKYGGLLIGAGIIAMVVQIVLSIIAQVVLGVVMGIVGASFQGNEPSAAGIGVTIISMIVFVVLQISLQMFIMLGIVKIGLNALSDNDPSLNDLFSQGSKLLKTIGAGLLVYLITGLSAIPGIIFLGLVGGFGGNEPSGFLVFIGFLVAYLPCIYISVRLSMFIFCIVDQDSGAVDSIKQSWAMTQNNFWPIIGLGIVATLLNFAGLLALIIGLIITVPLTYLMIFNAYRWMRHGFRSCDLT